MVCTKFRLQFRLKTQVPKDQILWRHKLLKQKYEYGLCKANNVRILKQFKFGVCVCLRAYVLAFAAFIHVLKNYALELCCGDSEQYGPNNNKPPRGKSSASTSFIYTKTNI